MRRATPAPDPSPAPPSPPPEAPGLIVGFIPVRCPLCRQRPHWDGTSRTGFLRYYRCKRCGVRLKAVDVGQR